MKRSNALAGTAVAMAAWLATAGTASANMPIMKKAKDAGYPATSCIYCHVEKVPKKGAVTQNDRGKFLVDEKGKRKADEIDVAWLKDYKEAKEAKDKK